MMKVPVGGKIQILVQSPAAACLLNSPDLLLIESKH